MYNILNLDYIEFEKFSKDLLERKINIKFTRFGPGADDGIDLISEDETIICQCKKYKSINNLRDVCFKEYNKIKDIKFEKYYFITTAELSKKQKDSILEVFGKFMNGYNNIISFTEINDFLDDTDNIDILKKHHKLWLTSSNVLNLFANRYCDICAEGLINDIEEDSKYFVATKAYYESIKLIEKDNILMIIGEPGIGKTMTSKMVIRYLLASYSKYKLRTIISHDLQKLMQCLGNEEYEIIYLDDFLGQTCLSIDDDLIKNINLILKYAKTHKNKKIILNSRITILNKAEKEKIEFEKTLKRLSIEKYTINLNEITKVDRALILYNLMSYYNVSYDKYDEIKNERRYLSIINHKSFNTRIIDKCMMNSCNIHKDDFYNYIISSFNNPKDVWDSEFNGLDIFDKLIMFQLFTLGDSNIPIEVLRDSFANYLLNTSGCNNLSNFNNIITRLSDSLISVSFLNNKKVISILNPSISDYIQEYLLCNWSILAKIYETSIYIEQMNKIMNLKIMDYNKTFDKVKSYNNSLLSSTLIQKKLNFVNKYNYCNPNIENTIISAFQSEVGGDYLIKILLNEKLRDFYDLDKYILSNTSKVGKVLIGSNIEYVEELLDYYADNNYNEEKINNDLKELYKHSLEDYLILLAEEEINQIITNDSIEEMFDIVDGEYVENDDYIYSVHSSVYQILEQYEKEKLENIKYFKNMLSLDIDNIIDSADISMLLSDNLNDYLNETIEDSKYDVDYYENLNQENEIIDNIFLQKYNY